MTKLDLSEKIVKLRKNNGLTQEQLSEQLNVSRQSVSKWESGQAAPDIDKIVALGEIFHVSTDYLLKPSELDELAMKAEMLEKRQQEIMENENKRKERQYCICVCTGIYLIAFAVFMLIKQVSWINDTLWNLFPGITLPVIILLAATAAAIFVCVKRKQRDGRQE
ncbi:helix-turn-helix domain-containing protein [Eisenbergiella sp.]